MEKVRYMISDAADMVHVESHVLRYWEEELDLSIPRNEMGHRYYTRENIKEFQRIKDLKEQGYQLKAIRMILHNGKLEDLEETKVEPHSMAETMKNAAQMSPEQMLNSSSVISTTTHAPSVRKKESVIENQQASLTAEERMSQFRELMSDIVGQAIAQNNEELSQTIGRDVQELVLKEMNYLMREQDMAQEERYKKLDAAIRGNIKRKHSFFQKKEKKSNPENKVNILGGKH